MKDEVYYIGSESEQVKWGNNDDPKGILEIGKKYTLLKKEYHKWHTKYILEQFPDKQFNSVSFMTSYDYKYEQYKKKEKNWYKWWKRLAIICYVLLFIPFNMDIYNHHLANNIIKFFVINVLLIPFFVFFITGIIMVQFEPENPVMT